MIICINYENLHLFGSAFSDQFRLRHRCFIERLQYDVQKYNAMEYDQYDTPAATYLVYVDKNNTVYGCSRMTPVSQGSMLKKFWPEMVSNPADIFTGDTWEGTRFCIDKDLPPDMRKQIAQELTLAYIEFGLRNRIRQIIGVMPTYILRSVFASSGCLYSILGPSKRIDGYLISAASMTISSEQLTRARNKTGLHHPVIYDESAFTWKRIERTA
jgi:N-acyl-L-homoserine lactone synthetase